MMPVSDVVDMLQLMNNLNKHLAKYAPPSVEYEFTHPDGSKGSMKREELFEYSIQKLCDDLLYKAAGRIDGT